VEWVEKNRKGMGGGKIVKRERETGRRVGGGDERMDVREEVGEREIWLNSGLFLSLSLALWVLQGSLSSPTENL
jgi:hypothetical protein